MTASKRIMVIAIMGVVTALRANALDFTFNVAQGDWSLRENWWPQTGPPGTGDTATIPAGKLCKVELADAAITKLIVAASGKVQLINKTLALGWWHEPQPLGTDGRIMLYGTIEVLKTCELHLHRWGGSDQFWLEGPGVMVATGSTDQDKNALTIIYVPPPESPTHVLHIGALGAQSPTIRGEVTFLAHIDNHGLLIVDDAGDTMRFGPGDPPVGGEIQIGGSTQGLFLVSAGRMEFRWTNPRLDGQRFQCPWIVGPDGTLELTPQVKNTNWQECQHSVTVSSGTLRFNMPLPRQDGTTFGTTGNLQFNRVSATPGRIWVRAGQVAQFKMTGQ